MRPLLCSLIWIVSMLLPAAVAFGAENNQVSATLTPHQFSTQQPARLAVTLEGKQDAEIELPEVEGLVFHQRGQSSQFQMINGKSSSSVTYTYLVQGTKPGEYTIPPITVTTKSGTQQTEPITCSVVDSQTTLPQHRPAQPPASSRVVENQLDNVAFITLIPEKETAYVGELIPTTIKAYFDRRVKFKFNALPELIGDGFLVDKLGNEPLQQEEIIGDKPYKVLTWNTILTGIKEGDSELRMQMDVSMLVRSQQRRRLPGFGGGLQDDFFNDFFGRYENQPIRVESPLKNMVIHSLPEQGKPDNFSGAIGTFTLNMQAQPTTITEGDPITLMMSIAGSGNFDNVSIPSITDTDGIKIYSPTSSFIQGDGQEKSRKEFEQAVVITDPHINSIPPAVFNYFDPVKEQYQTAVTNPIPITVSGRQPVTSKPIQVDSPGKRGGGQSTSLASLPFAGLAPVKLFTGTVSGNITPLFRKPVFLLAAALLLAAITGVSAYRIRTHYLAGNPGIVFQKKVEQQRKACIHSFHEIQLTEHTDYLEAARGSLQEFLALIWKCEAASITTADVQKHLGTDHPITELFIHGDNASYGASDFAKPQRDKLHTEILEIIATLT